MVIIFKQSASILVPFLTLMLTFTKTSNVSAQLVTNGSFENTAPGPVSGNDIEGWVIEVASGVNPVPDFEIVADPIQHGSHALRVVVHAIGPNAWSIQAVADSIPVEPGKTYRFSIWAKTDNPGSQANFTVGNYSFNEYGVIRPATLSSEWREFTFDFTITDQQTLARAPLHFSIAANVGDTIYLDNLTIALPGEVWTGPPLASGKSKFLGCAHSNAQAPNFAAYWNQVTPENASKWGSVEGARDMMNWGGLDAAYNLAKDHGFPFRFHVLIWGNQQPAWIESLPANEQLAEIEEWFAAVAARYPDIDYLEVVNEPLHDPPDGPMEGNYINALGGSNNLYGTGWDWVIKSFELARKYFPDSVKLMINDYSIVNDDNATTNYLTIINLLKERGLIDGIGIQGHAFSTRGSVTTMTTNLNRLATTGLLIQVCEMDIDGPTDQVQLGDYQRILPTFWEHPAVEGITLWGWRPGLWRNAERAYLVDQNSVERPALEWLRTYLASPLRPVPLSPVGTTGEPRNPVLSWHAAESATSYHLQVAGNRTFSTVVVDTTVADTLLQLSPLEANTRYYWRVRAANEHGTSAYSVEASFMTGDQITAVDEFAEIPIEFGLSENYPNPFNPTTSMQYSVGSPQHVSLKVYDALGHEVATLVDENKPAGHYRVTFNASGLASGVYFIRLSAGEFVEMKKAVLIR